MATWCICIPVLVLTVFLPEAFGLKCFDCEGVDNIENCNVKKECQSNESCHVRKYITDPGVVKYDLECMPNWFCEQIAHFKGGPIRKRNNEIVLWNRCCTDGNCNKYFTASGRMQYSGLRCLQCDHVTRPDECQTSAICQQGQMCYAGEYLDQLKQKAYRLGCRGSTECVVYKNVQPILIGRRENLPVSGDLFHHWFDCCGGNDCNSELCPDNVCVTSPPPTATTTTVPTTTFNAHQQLQCMHCSNIPNPKACSMISLCSEGESCYIEGFRDAQGNSLYNTGCADNKTCGMKSTVNGRTGTTGTCFTCCHHSFCNYYACQIPPQALVTATSTSTTTTTTTLPTTTSSSTTTSSAVASNLLCANCQGMTNPSNCKRYGACSKGEVCYIERVRGTAGFSFNTGCLDQQSCSAKSTQQSRDRCFECCGTFMCNYHGCSGPAPAPLDVIPAYSES